MKSFILKVYVWMFCCIVVGISPVLAYSSQTQQFQPEPGENWFFEVNGMELGNSYSGCVSITIFPHNASMHRIVTRYNLSGSEMGEKTTFLMVDSLIEWNPETNEYYHSILWIPINLHSEDVYDAWDRFDIFTVTKTIEGFQLLSATEARITSLDYDPMERLVRVEETAYFETSVWELVPEDAPEPEPEPEPRPQISGPATFVILLSLTFGIIFIIVQIRNRKEKTFTYGLVGLLVLSLFTPIFIHTNPYNALEQKGDTIHNEPLPPPDSSQTPTQIVKGTLTQNTVWSGDILVEATVVIPTGVNLTILAGTVIRFKHYRDYTYPVKVYLIAQGGNILAVGNSSDRIWFTSDAPSPINGDWGSISLKNTNQSEFKYVIVEYAEIGIMQFDSEVSISYSIIRWCNSEGLYSERSKPYYGHNVFYNNSYHDIALEQFNYEVMIEYNIFLGGFFSVHAEKSNVTILYNYFSDYLKFALTGGMASNISVINNSFANYPSTFPWAFDASTNVIYQGNNLSPIMIPILPVFDLRNTTLPYMPGSLADQYTYNFAQVDVTREVETRIGQNLSFGWSLEFVNSSLYRFKLGGAGLGNFMDFVKLDPVTQSKTYYKNDYIMNPRGLAYDGNFFWINDFSLLKIFKFNINASNAIEIHDSFDIPYKHKGGCMGMTTDGQFLYLISRDRWTLYKINKTTGTLIDEYPAKSFDLGNAIVWADGVFWSTGGYNILKKWVIDPITDSMECVGLIFSPGKDAWAITFDGEFLWTLLRTCEMWNDDKICMINIIDDSLTNFYTHFGYFIKFKK